LLSKIGQETKFIKETDFLIDERLRIINTLNKDATLNINGGDERRYLKVDSLSVIC